MTKPGREGLLSAIEDFRRARRRASLQDIAAQLTGRPADLFPYEEVRQKLKAKGTTDRGLQEIPLDAIVGSVGRYADFNRSFLPRRDSDAERWAGLKARVARQGILSPIQVYQIGEAYFVLDGNHRVSIARQLGFKTIQAHVSEVYSKVPLSPEDNPDDLILKAEYADFLESTHLDTLRPWADLSVTVPGQYLALEEEIELHQYRLGLEQGREVPYDEAVAHWYDKVYLPVIQVIRERGILRDFPGRTETDLYVWVFQHRVELERELGWKIRPHEVAEDLVEQSSPKAKHVLARLGERVMAALTPLELQAGPRPGHWRQEHVALRHDNRLFGDILVAISGQEQGWNALDEALVVARREGAHLHGLHVVPAEEELRSEQVQAVQAEFNRRCQQAGVPGELAVEVGVVWQRISRRARWVDLVILSLTYPPEPQPIARLSSGLSTLLRHCPRPILTVPQAWPHLEHALLAYDGSPKADEALFVATYLAASWKMALVVMTAIEAGRATARTLGYAQDYLEEHGVKATMVKEKAPVIEAILRTAEAHHSDLIIMGGYGLRPVLEVVLGSAVEATLRASRRPMLICR